jgi:hypothetical protein
MSKIKPVRYAAVVKIYVCASGYDTLPAGTVRALPGNSKATVRRKVLFSHTHFSPPSLLNHWNLDAGSIDGKLFATEAVRCNGHALNNIHLFTRPTTIKQAA